MLRKQRYGGFRARCRSSWSAGARSLCPWPWSFTTSTARRSPLPGWRSPHRGWVAGYTPSRRFGVPYEASVLGGIALLFLGLAPEEGPVGLLLWFVFGVTWPILHEALAARHVARLGRRGGSAGRDVPGRPDGRRSGNVADRGVLLLASMARRPGQNAKGLTLAAAPKREQAELSTAQQALPFLFSFASLMWIWLVPALLIGLGMPALSFGALLGVSWLARLIGARAAPRLPDRVAQALVVVGLPMAIAAIAVSRAPWQLAAGLIVYGTLMGIIGAKPAIERPELARLPGQAQALGEVLGPLAGIAVYLLGGATALFASAALASIALAIALTIPAPSLPPLTP